MSPFDIPGLKKEIEELEKETIKDGFWNDIKNSSATLTKLKQIKNKYEKAIDFLNSYPDERA